MLEPCPYCHGRGRVANTVSLSHDILRELEGYIQTTGSRKVVVTAREDVIEWIIEDEAEWLEKISNRFQVEIEFRSKGPSLEVLTQPPFEIFARY